MLDTCPQLLSDSPSAWDEQRGGGGRLTVARVVSISLPPDAIETIAQRAAEIVLATIGRPAPATPYMTVAEAADYLRCSRQRIYDLRSSGRLSRLGDGGRALVAREELDALVGKNVLRDGTRRTYDVRH